MKKLAIVLILILVMAVFFAGIYFIEFTSKGRNVSGNSIAAENENANISDTGNTANLNQENSASGEKVAGAGGGSGGGGSGGSGAGGSAPAGSGQNNPQLPGDLNQRECGYYFAGYGVCAGTCPQGTCVSEGRSCYCKT